MKKKLVYIVVFMIIGTLITVISLCYLDNFIYSLSQTSGIDMPNQNITTQIKDIKKIVLPTDCVVEYSIDNKYYTYLKDGKIYINSTNDGKNLNIVEEKQEIVYSKLLYDKNLILYFTAEESGNTTKLVLNTYEIDNERKSSYNKVNITNFSKIKDMNMSPIVNMIYINVETKSGLKTNNIIYKIDLFNSMWITKSGLIVDKMIVLQHKDAIYYEDNNSNIYRGNARLNLFKEKVTMIGIDEDDKLYFLSKENKDKVYVLKDNSIVKTIELSDTDLVTTYTNNYGVYLIYPTYIMNIASKDLYKRIGRLTKYVTFEAVKQDTMYLKTLDNLLIKTKLEID